MSRIIMDVTQLAHWTGKITGIPRVMDELAKRLQKTDAQILFATWDPHKQEFYEIDFQKTLVQRAGVIYKQPQGDSTAKQSTSFNQALLRKVAKKALAAVGRVSPDIANDVKSRVAQARVNNYEPVPFNDGDILFIPWGEWWNPAFKDCLLRLHKKQVRLVHVIHDIGPTVWPQFFEQVDVSPADYNASILPKCDLILAVSKNTKNELTQWLKQQSLPLPRIEVFRLGDDIKISKPQKPADPAFITSKLKGNDFILCVGTVEAKKNHQLFYYVYKLAKARGIELPKLVVVGRRGYQTEATIKTMTLDPDVKDKFVFLFNTSDEELSWLYDHCMFTVLASFHEGWGIPIAESLARGVPVLSSNTSSMIEIAPGITEHFSPASSDECLAAITAWAVPKNLQKAKNKAKSYKKVSWNQTSEQVFTYLSSL
jgi:hypothetical protein